MIAPLILYSDETSLSKNCKVVGHPIVMSIANISCENRYLDEGHCLLVVLPVLRERSSFTTERVRLLHDCLECVLKPLKAASFE